MTAQKVPTSPMFDGNWWLSASSDEQLGYLNGDADCRTFELGMSRKHFSSLAEEQRLVSNFYEKQPDLRSESVFQVIHRQQTQQTPPTGGEVWHERHWQFDGDWWTESSPAERTGFIEGYLRCYSEKRSKKKAKFSDAVSHYVEQINRWYRVDALPPIPRPIIETKIADVLFKFRDR